MRGWVEALRTLVAELPPDVPAAVLIVLHLPKTEPSALPAILGRASRLPVRSAVDGEPLRHGRVYIAPVDRHLLVIDGHVRLSRGPSENGHRPAGRRGDVRSCTGVRGRPAGEAGRIRLPRVRRLALRDRQRPDPLVPVPGGSRLLVEDAESAGQLIRSLIERLGATADSSSVDSA